MTRIGQIKNDFASGNEIQEHACPPTHEHVAEVAGMTRIERIETDIACGKNMHHRLHRFSQI